MNPLTESVHRVDVKMQIVEIPRQVIMTKDNVNVRIDSVLYWHIENPFRAKFNVSNVRRALVERWDSSYYIMFTFVLTIIRYICRTQTTLRHILGAKVLQDCIENREAIAKEIQDVTRPVAKQWGVRVSFFFLRWPDATSTD